MDRGVLVTDIGPILIKIIGYPNWNPFSRKKAVSCSEKLAKCPKFEFQNCQIFFFSTILGTSSSKNVVVPGCLPNSFSTRHKNTHHVPVLVSGVLVGLRKLATWQTKLSSSEFWAELLVLGSWVFRLDSEE